VKCGPAPHPSCTLSTTNNILSTTNNTTMDKDNCCPVYDCPGKYITFIIKSILYRYLFLEGEDD
jgi:hypothetical protein